MNPVCVVGMGVAVPGASEPREMWDRLRQPLSAAEPPSERPPMQSPSPPDMAHPDRSRVPAGYITDLRPHPRLDTELRQGWFPERDHATIWLRHCALQAMDGVTMSPGTRGHLTIALNVAGSPRLEESLLVEQLAAMLATKAGDHQERAAALRPCFPFAVDDPGELIPWRTARRAIAGVLPGTVGVQVVDAACASSLFAVDLAAKALREGRCDVALGGGVTVLTRLAMVLGSGARNMSPRGAIRAFDAAADGTVFSDGAAVVALKLLDRALADGDRVLGILHSFGASSDGKGKAIHTPNPAGQVRAVRRAQAAAGIAPGDVAWIIPHGTGAPVGDRTELATLHQCAGHDTVWQVAGNKPAFGHTGAASGTVSLIHALLALQRESIPGQVSYDTPVDPGLLGERLRVVTQERPWPAREGRTRLVGMSAYGLGGINGHLVVGDRPPSREASPGHEPVVIVDWAACLPGRPDRESVLGWLTTGRKSWPDTHGDVCPPPDIPGLLIPPVVLKKFDRNHTMTLACAHEVWSRLGDRCDELRGAAGVVLGFTGPCRGEALYLAQVAAGHAGDRLAALDGAVPVTELVRRARSAVPPPTFDTVLGLMPNVAAGRICSLLDLHGPSLAVDSGADSGLAALDIAAQYLRTGEFDLALVGAACGHDTASLPFSAGTEMAEGAFMIAVTRASVARRCGLPILATVSPADCEETTVADRKPSHGAADRLIDLLHAALVQGTATTVLPVEDPATRAVRVTPLQSAPSAGAPGRLTPVAADTGQRWRLTPTAADLGLLAHHVIQGRPSVPAALILDFAAEAATMAVPGLRPVGFIDARFHRYLKCRSDGTLPSLVISAERVPGAGPPAVRVRLGTSVPDCAPPNAEVVVLLGQAGHGLAPRTAVTSQAGREIVDPYLSPASPATLSGPFAAMAGIRRTATGAVARFLPGRLPAHRIPVMAIDCLFRTAVLANSAADRLPVAVPTAFIRLTLWEDGDDNALAGRFSGMSLSYSGREGSLSAEREGRELVSLSGLDTHLLELIALEGRRT